MKTAKRIIWSVVLAFAILIGAYYLVFYIQFGGRWWSKDYRLDTLTETQTETLSTYVGLPANAIQEVTDYCFYQGQGSDSYVTFIAQIDEEEIQSLKERFDTSGHVVENVVPIRLTETERELYYWEAIYYEISTEDGIDWIRIYDLSHNGGYFFLSESPGDEICFTGSTDEG